MALTREEGHRLELLGPVLRDLNRGLLVAVGICGHALLVGVLHHPLEVLRKDGIHDIEEVLTRRALVLGELGREVLGERGILLELRPQPPHRQLVVSGHGNILHVRLLEQLLLLGEHVPQEVLGHACLLGQVKLACTTISQSRLTWEQL